MAKRSLEAKRQAREERQARKEAAVAERERVRAARGGVCLDCGRELEPFVFTLATGKSLTMDWCDHCYSRAKAVEGEDDE